jgi:hypothetical protein
MSEEFRLLLEMKRTYKIILLLVGFVAGSCILQLAIVVSNFKLDDVHQYVEEQSFVSADTLWSVFEPTTISGTTDSELNRQVKTD